MYALLSVSDKTNIIFFAKELISLGYKIISTGGTYKKLKDNNLEVVEINNITNFKECFDGRVKTLHPLIHGGILNKRDDKNHQKQKKTLGIVDIDLVCVNLYPFKQCVKNKASFDILIENIDIGGPTMIRAAAKNFKDVVVATDVSDYEPIINAIKKDICNFDFKKTLMIKAYEHTASYDSFIANHFNENYLASNSTNSTNNKSDTSDTNIKTQYEQKIMPNKLFLVANKILDTKYGENPHQKGALYQYDGDDDFMNNFHIIKGEPSFNNLLDMSNALKITTSFLDKQNTKKVICIVKHGNPCGFALGEISEDICDIYDKSLVCDSISAYGGVACVSEAVDKKLATKMSGIFFEVIYAPYFAPEAIEVFSTKKRIKLFAQYTQQQIQNIKNLNQTPMLKITKNKFTYKQINGGLLYQQNDNVLDEEVYGSELKTNTKANDKQIRDMVIANKLSALSKSNCIVFVKNNTLLAIGMGMTSRVDATYSAIKKADDMKVDLKNCVLASEAFFPFRDSIQLAAKIGVSCIIEPGGSIRDDEIIECAKANNITLYFSHKRHFLH